MSSLLTLRILTTVTLLLQVYSLNSYLFRGNNPPSLCFNSAKKWRDSDGLLGKARELYPLLVDIFRLAFSVSLVRISPVLANPARLGGFAS